MSIWKRIILDSSFIPYTKKSTPDELRIYISKAKNLNIFKNLGFCFLTSLGKVKFLVTSEH
jgi:hypothetical protein